MESYEEVFKNHNGFVSNKWVHYFYIYDRLFSEYRAKNQPLTIMEIGVDRGGSLEIWKKYLPENSKIHGVDINPKCSEINFSENIFFHLGSASDRAFMEKTFADIDFDIILDDGSHICSDVIEAFKIMFPKIKNGGLYVVEDLHTSYWVVCGGGIRKKGSSIEYFKKFIETLNADYIYPFNFLNIFTKYFNSDFRNKVKRILQKNASKKYFNGIEYSKLIESMTFYDSICAVKKFSRPKDAPFKSVISGNENIGSEICFNNEIKFIQEVKDMFVGGGGVIYIHVRAGWTDIAEKPAHNPAALLPRTVCVPALKRIRGSVHMGIPRLSLPQYFYSHVRVPVEQCRHIAAA